MKVLVEQFNSSSKSVRNAFAKLLENAKEKERQEKLQAKIEEGIRDIQNGNGIYRLENETTEQFFERLCTE